MTRKKSSPDGQPARPGEGNGSPAFLLAQVGAHAAAKFAERLGPLGLTPAHVGSLRLIAASAGSSQQQVAERLGMFPSRLVALVDELQERALVQRVDKPNDRRVSLLQPTAKGREALQSIGRVAREHQEALCNRVPWRARHSSCGCPPSSRLSRACHSPVSVPAESRSDRRSRRGAQ